MYRAAPRRPRRCRLRGLLTRLAARCRREQHETSATRVRALLHDARKGVRRLARAAAGEPADVRHLLELAYGKRGRMMHVLARARNLVRLLRGCAAAEGVTTSAHDTACFARR